MKHLIIISLFLLPLGHPEEYPLKNGKPTREGIERYIEDNRESFIREYQDFVQDSLHDVLVYAGDFGNEGSPYSLELGWYFMNEVIISSDPQYIAYELADLSRFKRSRYSESNHFVKSALYHELTHHYINLIGREMEDMDLIHVDPAYHNNMWNLQGSSKFGSTFIEEGICEYLCGKMDEIIVPDRPFIPATQNELTDMNNRYKVMYKYSAHYLKTFLDTSGFKRGVKILLHNPPPSYEEILNPDLFYERLEFGDVP